MASYGEYVMHRSCHGLRLEIHEPAYVVEEDEVTLQRAMTFTVEPDIRLPCRGAPFPHILSSVASAGQRRRAALSTRTWLYRERSQTSIQSVGAARIPCQDEPCGALGFVFRQEVGVYQIPESSC